MSFELRDQPVEAALRADLADLGDGVTAHQVGELAATRWPDRVIRRLRREGWVIETVIGADGERRYKPYSEPATSTEAPGPSPSGDAPPVALGSPPGASLDAAQRLFDPLRMAA